MLPDCRCFINACVQMLSGTPDIVNGLQAVFDLAGATSSDWWTHSLAKALQHAIRRVQATVHTRLAADIEAFVYAMESSADALVRGLVEWKGPR